MALNFLHFNTEVIRFMPGGTCESSDLDLDELKTLVKPYVKNVEVIRDCDFKLDKQINFVVKSCFFPIETTHQGEIFPVF